MTYTLLSTSYRELWLSGAKMVSPSVQLPVGPVCLGARRCSMCLSSIGPRARLWIGRERSRDFFSTEICDQLFTGRIK
jgi:hypothetical protein